MRGAALLCCAAAMSGNNSVAHAQRPSCSAVYHVALNQIKAARGNDLGQAFSALRQQDSVLPGRWIYAQSLFPKTGKKAKATAERVCAEQIKTGGRVRCARFADTAADPLPQELTIGGSVTPEEMRILKALNDLVEARGAVPEMGSNGRYTWVAQRATNDLNLYLSQPAHPALCSGGTDFGTFYEGSFKALQKRIDDVTELGKRARALALVRIKEVIGEATPPNATTLIALVGESVGIVASPAQRAEVVAEKTPLAALQRAKQALFEAQAAAAEKANEPTAAEKVMAAGRAVRMIEAAAYADVLSDRYAKFSAAVMGVPAEIKAAHGKTCGCEN